MSTGIIVLGMHRSGTSLVSEILHRWGAFGCQQECLPSDKWNARGYWELSAMVNFNTRILGELRASWDYPPSEALDYQLREMATRPDFRDEAQKLLSQMHSVSGDVWFWKDPRLSLLLPFWQTIWGTAIRYIICVRNPLEICQSLQKRDGLSYPVSIALWQRYMLSVLRWTRGLPAHVVSYDAILRSPEAECERLERFLLPVSNRPESVTRMRGAVETELRHFRAERTAPAYRLTRKQRHLFEALERVAAGSMRLAEVDLSQYALAGSWRISLYMSLLVQRAVLRGYRMLDTNSQTA